MERPLCCGETKTKKELEEEKVLEEEEEGERGREGKRRLRKKKGRGIGGKRRKERQAVLSNRKRNNARVEDRGQKCSQCKIPTEI